MSDEPIDVSDIQPAVLLASLYNGASVFGAGIYQARPGQMTVEQAQKLIDGDDVETDYVGGEQKAAERKRTKSAYFDYLYGKPLKLRIDGKKLNPWGYDRDHGQGAAQRIVDNIRKAQRAA